MGEKKEAGVVWILGMFHKCLRRLSEDFRTVPYNSAYIQ